MKCMIVEVQGRSRLHLARWRFYRITRKQAHSVSSVGRHVERGLYRKRDAAHIFNSKSEALALISRMRRVERDAHWEVLPV